VRERQNKNFSFKYESNLNSRRKIKGFYKRILNKTKKIRLYLKNKRMEYSLIKLNFLKNP
jgi:hypothetical protein